MRFRKFIWVSVIAVSLASCGLPEKIVELQDRAASLRYVNKELKYAGYELKWRDAEGKDTDGFKKEFDAVLGKTLSKRIPTVFQGERSIIIVIHASQLYNPNALQRALFQNPSIRIKAVVQDASTGEALLTYEDKVTDVQAPSPQGGVSFRLGSISGRLARSTVNYIVTNLRNPGNS